jgi:antitoxin component YwqK of YwqJK toxin-antitoxin module
MHKLVLLTTINLFFTFISYTQDLQKELYLKHSVRQDGESYNFFVLEKDEKRKKNHDETKYYFWYKSQKVMCTQGGSSGTLLNGEFESFYDNKQLSKNGTFKKGLKDGEWKYWREDGSLIRTENWKKGTKYGKETVFDDKGQVVVKINYLRKSFSRKTADSLVVSNYAGTKKTISIFDEKGEIISVQSFKGGREIKPKKKFKINSIFRKKEGEIKEKAFKKDEKAK